MASTYTQLCVSLFHSQTLTHTLLPIPVYTLVSIVSIISAASVLIVTLAKTIRQVREASLLGIKTVLSQILLRDGKSSVYRIHIHADR